MYFGLYFQNIQYAHKFKIYLLVNYISLYEFLKCRIFTALEKSISFCIKDYIIVKVPTHLYIMNSRRTLCMFRILHKVQRDYLTGYQQRVMNVYKC